MKVTELIEALKEAPGEYEVWLFVDPTYSCGPAEKIEVTDYTESVAIYGDRD